MFSYYGSKSKIAHLYPAPQCAKIVEPFAGSARYSLLHFERDVELYDLSEYVVQVWNYLFNVSEKELLSLPDVPSKVHLDNYKELCEAERYLIGFSLCRGKAKPRKTGHGQNSWARDKIRIANNLHKIRHWSIEQKSYDQIPNENATWFIDPPYQKINVKANGDRYPHSELDYDNLADYATERKGQVIMCEGEGADYLPFRLLTITNANTNNHSVKSNSEYIFTR